MAVSGIVFKLWAELLTAFYGVFTLKVSGFEKNDFEIMTLMMSLSQGERWWQEEPQMGILGFLTLVRPWPILMI